MKLRMTLLLVAVLFGHAAAFSSQELSNFFEWGEYQKLIDSLEPHIVVASCSSDSEVCAELHCFLGVAYYGKGRVGEAQAQFRQALSFRPDIRLDSTYLSAELGGLFEMIRVDFLEKLSRTRSRDSLLLVEKKAFSANVQAIRSEEARKSRRSGALVALSFYTLSAAVTAAAVYEYRATRQPYAEFTAAARGGDKVVYDRLRPQIRRVNAILTGCVAGASVSMAAAITITVRSFGGGGK